MTIRTRFAPSPTGYLHIGGVRTALFCWLFARKNNGQFILRIDDTDQQRNIESALEPILDGLRWLGIDWDEGPGVGGTHEPYYQSQRTEKYQAAVEQLLQNGFAYRDFSKPDEIQAERDASMKSGGTFTYSRRWMAENDADVRRYEAEGRTSVVRLKMPREGKLVIDDLVRGRVEFDWATEQDHVIQRADGTFIYHLANVVDDQDFEISHVIRAEEHLSNTPRQIFMIQSLGYCLPAYAHLPFVAEPGSKTKLSKRKLDKYLKNADFKKLVDNGTKIASKLGLKNDIDTFNPVVVDFYKAVGYLPEAIVNAMAMIGWSLDDKTELFLKPDELINVFSLEKVTKGAASFDPAKLFSFQERHFQNRTAEEKRDLCKPFLEKAGIKIDDNKLLKLITFAADRIKVSGDILDFDEFFVSADKLQYDAEAVIKRITQPAEAIPLLTELAAVFEKTEPNNWQSQTLHETTQTFIDERQIKINQVIHALRVAVTGKTIGIGMFDALELLGKQESLARMARAMNGV
ncbi:MAG: glutamate--tRNA ligase [Planctomycetaceae bacterium]|jgi:glutamyl-tRNA synthetase|nr:glutamate--tRNA ligase [Planctomycetaceae bacterium]